MTGPVLDMVRVNTTLLHTEFDLEHMAISVLEFLGEHGQN